MSWWETGNGDDVIGDQPADLVRHGLRKIAETRTNQAQEKPRLAELLQAIGTVATGAGGKTLEAVPPNLREIVAELKSAQTLSSGLIRDSPQTRDLVSILSDSLGEIAAVYQERWERNPRFSEWLQSIIFVLRYRPEDFVSDGVQHPPAQLKAVTDVPSK